MNVLSDEGQFVINVHSVVPEVHRIKSIRSCEVMIFHLKHVLGRRLPSELEGLPVPECSVTSYGPRIWTALLTVVVPPLANLSRPVRRIWFPCFHSIFLQIFLFVLVSDFFRFSFYIVFQKLFKYLYSFSIAFCFSFSISYSTIITFWFSISFTYCH